MQLPESFLLLNMTMLCLPGDGLLFWLVLLLFSLCGYLYSVFSIRFQGPKAPLVGVYSIFEPRAVANYRFFENAAKVVSEGYAQV